MIDLQTAAELLDLGTRIKSKERGDEQLEGAVALHDMLSRHNVAYLADEVGMGKTYVALAVIALFRHYDPHFRVLFIAPRGNIQNKWMKEFKNFVHHNVRFADLRVKGIDEQPARPLVHCDNLLALARETGTDPNRDFFTRMTSFSFPLTGNHESWKSYRDAVRTHLPWMAEEVFDLRSKDAFKDNFARALCCALPVFDLVVVDEAHNLKHGYSTHGASRNRVLGLALGHPSEKPDKHLFPGYGPRARRVLFLSATPIEETHRHLWNQLHVFGQAQKFEGLRDDAIEVEEKKRIAAQILIRRVTSIRTGGQELTKNLYRREWRRGGVQTHDEPLRIQDTRQRLVVALVQKKVSEVLQDARFGASFQIGMLASFESFLETAKVNEAAEDRSNFDDTDQTEETDEREGIDVDVINRLARDYRAKFNQELPHPKMDAVVDSLSHAWKSGQKALVFVRRVASVKELKRKLDDRYDAWLLDLLRTRLPADENVQVRFEGIVKQYKQAKNEARERNADVAGAAVASEDDRGGNDTFFAWFFRGEGPGGVVSGATVQKRFIQRGARYSTFFHDNHVMVLLGSSPNHVTTDLAESVGLDVNTLRLELQQRSGRFLSGKAKKLVRADRFDAVQAAAIELLADRTGPLQEKARVVWREFYETFAQKPATKNPPEIGDWLELPTFFTQLRKRVELREHVWPRSNHLDFRKAFREEEQRAQLLATAARLGHAFIDLYVLTINRLRSLDSGEREDEEGLDADKANIEAYLDLLQEQMHAAETKAAGFGGFDELAALANHFDLILDVNDPDARERPLSETARAFGSLLRQQQPVGGMSGTVNQTLVRQFRMPGYPFVLVTTDLLQEGEDLHTFCSAIHHYGISWTPSAMEQRIGRIDRVRSATDRLLSGREKTPDGNDLLQVYFPHLEDTVEVLQVERVLERMNTFLRLMHEGLHASTSEQRKIDVAQEMATKRRYVEPIRERLRSAFPVPAHIKKAGEQVALAVTPDLAKALRARFERIRQYQWKHIRMTWENLSPAGVLLGTVHLDARKQPFALYEQSNGERIVVRCISPVGRVSPAESEDDVAGSIADVPVRVGMVQGENRSYDLTVENDVLLGDESSDRARIGMLIQRVVQQADELEQLHLEGIDQEMAEFRSDLEKERSHDA